MRRAPGPGRATMKGMISADSHITEAPGTYVDHIERKYKDTAPRIVHDAKLGDVFVVEGFSRPLQIGLVAAAGKKPEELAVWGARFDNLHRGGWDPEARM